MRLRNVVSRLLHDPLVRVLKKNANYSRQLPRLAKTDTFGNCRVVDWPGASRGLVTSLTARVHLTAVQRLLSALNMVTALQTSSPVSLKKCPFPPPDIVRGMKHLDRSVFCKNVSVVGMKVPDSSVAAVSKRYKNSLLKIPKLKPIAELSETDDLRSTHKLFLFSPLYVPSIESFSSDDREFLVEQKVDLGLCGEYGFTLGYENWTYDEIVDAVLPEDEEGVGGFSIVGHIAHLNLRDSLLDYKTLIGEVILDKISTVKTVVNKTHNIDSTYRNFQMEVLAGEPDFVTVAREHGRSYKLDFSKVYWNPRLATEHQRIVELVKDGDVMYDVFAGVGPFAVPAARKGCIVLANDLNPESYRWLQHNISLNKVAGKVTCFNMDGRDFITTALKRDLLERWKSGSADVSFHAVMNLPALAVDFLDAFRGLVSPREAELEPSRTMLPVIYCYCFSSNEDPIADASQRAAGALGVSSFDELEDLSVRIVRNVAPSKEMLCVRFRLPWRVMLADQSADEEEQPPEKRAKT